MKILSYILIILAFALAAFNITLIDMDNPLKGDSFIAIICIAAALCAIVLLLILLASKKIQEKIEE
ncbi:MAG: hypothetical protein OIF50_10105 [Flavobacteriaceae bacterium]|nr:hypothetical protein [Flavobacteriaceae bacterium]